MPDHKPNCKCLNCGKEFFKYPSQIKNGSGKYCSRKCAYSSDAWKENIGKGNASLPNRICKICGTPFKSSPSTIKKGRGIYCSPECKQKGLEQKRILDSQNRNKRGKRFNRICKVCGDPFYAASKNSKYCSRSCMWEDPEYVEKWRNRPQKKVSKETRRKMSQSQKALNRTKEKSTNWKGGMYALRKLVQNRPEYWEWRKAVFQKDNYLDWFSGCRGGKLEAHHIIPFSTIIKNNGIKTIEEAMACKELFDISNGVTMLKSNHLAYHEMWGKGEA
jgi:hypothetical protein